VAQRVGRGIALLFHVCGTRRRWVVSSTPRPHFTPRKDPVPILQEAGWAPGSVWTGGKSRPHRDSIPDRPARSQPLYRLSYPAHNKPKVSLTNCKITPRNMWNCNIAAEDKPWWRRSSTSTTVHQPQKNKNVQRSCTFRRLQCEKWRQTWLVLYNNEKMIMTSKLRKFVPEFGLSLIVHSLHSMWPSKTQVDWTCQQSACAW